MIKVEDVAKIYDGGTTALKGVNLNIAKGEFVFLVGPSGSGKSTLIRLMLRQELPSEGDIWVAGKHINKLPSWKVPLLRRSVGTVFQDFKLLPNKTVFENVAFALEVIGRPKHVVQNQVPQVLRLVGLAAKADRLPRQLSGGEQQRVSIARAFVNRPLILLADEPTGNLDPNTSVGIMRLLDRINRTGTTVVMCTHDRSIVDSMRRAAAHSAVLMVSKSALRNCSRSVHDSCASISSRSASGCGGRSTFGASASPSRRFSGRGGGAPPFFSLICGNSRRSIWPSRSGSFQKMWNACSKSRRCCARSIRQDASTA